MAARSILENTAWISILLLSTLSVQAQQRLFVSGGPTLAAMSSESFVAIPTPDWITTHMMGLGWSYTTPKRIEIKVGLFHERRGSGGSIILTDITGNSLGSGEIRYRWDHVTLPVSVGLRSAGRLAAFGMVGLVPAYTRHLDLHTPAFGGMSMDITTDYTDDASKWTMGISGEAGGVFTLNDRLGVLACVRYYHGLTPLELWMVEWRQRSVTLLLGLEWRLSKGVPADPPSGG